MATHKVAPGTVDPGKGRRKPVSKKVSDQVAAEAITAEQREAERRDGERRESERRASEQGNAVMAALALGNLTPEPKLQAPQAARSEYEQALADLQAKFGVVPVVKTTRSGKDQRNGITRPGDNTVTGRIWVLCDAITVAKGRPAAISELKHHESLMGVNDHTIKTQYARWRQYNGVTGRVDPLAVAPQKVMSHDGNP